MRRADPSVLGTYSIDPRGDETLPDSGSLRVSRRGRLVFYKLIRVARGAAAYSSATFSTSLPKFSPL
jgi:hypothetical protein